MASLQAGLWPGLGVGYLVLRAGRVGASLSCLCARRKKNRLGEMIMYCLKISDLYEVRR